MSEQLAVRARQNCCRLCLAPDNECISIYGNLKASNRETISNKIYACVKIKVNKDDALSTNICHICISYLNCWQNYKNRCFVAQQKQEEWLIGANNRLEKEYQDLRSHYYDLTNVDVSLDDKHGSIQIKKEPMDEGEEQKTDDEDAVRCDIDPTQFLATDVIEEEELKRLAANKNLTITKSGGEGGPQILTSLGLQSINSENINPFAFLSATLGASNENLSDFSLDNKDILSSTPGAPSQKPHDCRICKMKFSTRANARRHERNLHGLINDMALSPLSLSTAPHMGSVSSAKSFRRKSNTALLTPEMMGVYEYDNPEKYRHMLTTQKLSFIQDFEEFLKQYQTLTCKCCAKEYPKYKNFMAHMRKKYPTLPRACCFKCLKQFESKAIFVSHVKRRNCINLYKLYSEFEKAEKDDKLKAKEFLNNKSVFCSLCSKEFKSKKDFRNHLNEDHNEMIVKKETTTNDCVFCNIKIEDSDELKEHYSKMDCIIRIKCGTCDSQFETNKLFLDHIYKDHLAKDNIPITLLCDSNSEDDKEEDKIILSPAKSSQNDSTLREVESVPPVKTQFHSRMPQNCKICGARYNNYNNVLRHMEAKHPDQLPQTYKCSLCYVGFPRLSNLRDHMWEVHNKKLAKTKRDAEIYCRICLEKFTDKDSWVDHQTEQHDRYICCICFSQYGDVTVFKEHIKIHTSLSYIRPLVSATHSSEDSMKYTGRFDYVMKDLMSITNGDNDDEIKKSEPPNKKIKFEDEGDAAPIKTEFTTESNINPVVNQKSRNASALNKFNLFECRICQSSFNSSQGLSNHMRAHNAQENAKRASMGLPMLTKPHSNENGIENQNKYVRNNKVLALENRFRRMRCRLCQKRFSSKKVYRRHMLIEHHVQNVQFIHCAICRAEFANEKGLKVHMIKIHGETLRDIGVDNLQYECDICSIVYQSEEELMNHKEVVHNLTIDSIKREKNVNKNNSNNNNNSKGHSNPQNNDNNQYWYQCKYCASNFDSNKKLAIHINIHDEFDSNDYSCKDCGNVYSGRKSLWVHRYKKHPVLPSPTLCDICHKIFFTKEHLAFHKQHLHKIPMDHKSIVDAKTSKVNTNMNSENHMEDNDSHKKIIHVSGDDIQTVQVPAAQLAQVPCTVCHMKFSDEEAFTKHMKIHEESFFTDNPLASMFDTEPDDPDIILQKRINENGEFVCDICPKTFQQLTALKVHRNWHFRSDGKQATQADPSLWRSFAKKRKSSNTTIQQCKHCSSTFTSTNLLRRHIVEAHKPFYEKKFSFERKNSLYCTKCNLNFNNHLEWIEHKISDVKELSNNLLEWCCDICGKMVTRKDRLLQHMSSHLKESGSKLEKLLNMDNNSDIMESNSNSRDILSQNDYENRVPSVGNTQNDDDENNINFDNSSFVAGMEESIRSSSSGSESDSDDNEHLDDEENIDNNNDDDDDDGDIDNDDVGEEEEEDDKECNDDDDEDADRDMNNISGPHFCDLCQITFDTARELKAHVPTHFFHQAIEIKKENIESSTESNMSNEKNFRQNSKNPIEITEKLGNNNNESHNLIPPTQLGKALLLAKDFKSEFNENEKKDKIEYSIAKKELPPANVSSSDSEKRVEKLTIRKKDFTIKQEKPNEYQSDASSSDDESDDESDEDDDNEENEKNLHENKSNYNNGKSKNYNTNKNKGSEVYNADEYNNKDQSLDKNFTIDSDSGDDIDEDDLNDEEDDVEDRDDEIDEDEIEENEDFVENNNTGEIIGEEIVHDNAEYHENNIVDSDSNSGVNSVSNNFRNNNFNKQNNGSESMDDFETVSYENYVNENDEDDDDL